MRPSQTLQSGQLGNHHAQPGDRISVSHGTAWLTINGEDVLLTAGTSYCVAAAGHLLIEALPSCRYQFQRYSAVVAAAAPLGRALRASFSWILRKQASSRVINHAR